MHPTAVRRSFTFAIGQCQEPGPVGFQRPPEVKQPQNQTLKRPLPCCLPFSPLWESSIPRNKEQVLSTPTITHVHACLRTHTHSHTGAVFPEEKKSRSLLIHLEELLRTLIEGRIPSTLKRSERSWSHLHPPVFPASGNISSFCVEEEMIWRLCIILNWLAHLKHVT